MCGKEPAPALNLEVETQPLSSIPSPSFAQAKRRGIVLSPRMGSPSPFGRWTVPPGAQSLRQNQETGCSGGAKATKGPKGGHGYLGLPKGNTAEYSPESISEQDPIPLLVHFFLQMFKSCQSHQRDLRGS